MIGRASRRWKQNSQKAAGHGDIHSGGYQELRSWTLSEQNLNLDLPLYLSDGILHVIAPIGSIAGAGYLSRDLALDLDLGLALT